MTMYKEIEARLNQAIGLDAFSMGPSTVSMAVQLRMSKHGVKDVEGYLQLLESSESELQKLIEEVVVPETWFYRDREPFLALGQWAANHWMPAHPEGVLRLLSMPCATGEEPYSMVMALLEAGIPSSRFTIEAVDVSAVALERAAKAVYTNNSFRGHHLGLREKYFRPNNNGWKLAEEVRKQVHFRQANVLDPAFGGGNSVKDVIFCRNMLIYFDESAQRKVMESIKSLLSPTGLLFVGHAEAYIFSKFGFEAAQLKMAFAFCQGKGPTPPETPAKTDATPSRRSAVRRVEPMPVSPKTARAVPLVPKAAIAAPPSIAPDSKDLLAEVQALADAGRFDAARSQCQEVLRMHGPSSRAFYLLGLVNDADGKAKEAGDLYRKAVYLEPDHWEALAHLALLAEMTGDKIGAVQLQKRAKRAQLKMIEHDSVRTAKL